MTCSKQVWFRYLYCELVRNLIGSTINTVMYSGAHHHFLTGNLDSALTIVQGSHRSGKSGNSGKILNTFSSQGNQGKTGGFQLKSGKKFSNQGTFFQNHFQPYKPFNLRKSFFLSGEVLFLGSVSVIN